MLRYFRTCLAALVLFFSSRLPASAQAPEPVNAPLREVHVEGEKGLTEAQVISITGLVPGAQIGRDDLQAAADKLVQSGLFAKVSYNVQTKLASVLVTYHVEESPRIPVFFDNIPWLTDSALGDAIRGKLPFFDGTLPEAGAAVDQAVDAVKELLASRGVPGSLEHTVIANPLVSEFTLSGLLGLKRGDIADGMQVEGGWDRAREEYAHRGYLDAKIDPVPAYDDQGHTVSYSVSIQEGPQYRFGKMILTGISPAAERKLHAAWPIATGELFDKAKFEELLTKLQSHQELVFGELPVHYDNVGHWLQTDAAKGTVDVLLDFK